MDKVIKFRKIIGQTLRFLRTQKRLTQIQVAKKMGCSRPNVTQFENDGLDSMGIIFSFCEAMGVDVREFFAILPAMVDSNGEFRVHPKRLLEILRKDIEDVCEKRGVKAEVSIVTRILS